MMREYGCEVHDCNATLLAPINIMMIYAAARRAGWLIIKLGKGRTFRCPAHSGEVRS